MNRRNLLATGALAALAGCLSSSDDSEFSTERIEGATASDFESSLEEHGIDVDSTREIAGDLSLMYYRGSDPDAQIETIALAFVPYRGIVKRGLAFTALESQSSRHGVGMINRTWADSYASGDLSRSEYIKKVQDSYGAI